MTGKKNINVMYDAGNTELNTSNSDTDHHSDNDFVNNSINDHSLVKNPSKGNLQNGQPTPADNSSTTPASLPSPSGYNKNVDKLKAANGLLLTRNYLAGKYESDSDGDYDMSRSRSIVRVTKQQQAGKKLESPLVQHEDDLLESSDESENEDTLQLSESVMSVSSVYDTPKSMKQSESSKSLAVLDSQRSQFSEDGNIKKSASNKSVGSYRSAHSYHSDSESEDDKPKEKTPSKSSYFSSSFSSSLIQRSQSAKAVDSTRSSPASTNSPIPRSESVKSIGSNSSRPTISLEHLPRGGSLASPRSIPSTPRTPTSPTTPGTPSYFPRSESAKSIGSDKSFGLARSTSAKSVGSEKSSPLARSTSAKSIGSTHSPHSPYAESPRAKLEALMRSASIGSEKSTGLTRSTSAKSVGSTHSLHSPRSPHAGESPRAILEDLIRSNSAKSVGSIHSQAESPRSKTASPRESPSKHETPREILESLVKSNSAKSVGSTQSTESPRSKTSSPRSKTESPRSKPEDLAKSSSSKSVGSDKNIKQQRQFLFTVTSDDSDDTTVLDSATLLSPSPSTSSSTGRSLPLGSLAPSQEYLTKRRSSAFTEQDIVKPDMKVINDQIANTYGNSSDEEEEIEEEYEDDLLGSDEEEQDEDEESPRFFFYKKIYFLCN